MALRSMRLGLACLAFHGASSVLDEEALFQKELRSHAGTQAEDNPLGNLGDIFKNMQAPEGAPSGGAAADAPAIPGLPSIPGMPGGTQPKMEDMMKVLDIVMKALRNDTIVELLVKTSDEGISMINANKLKLEKRYAVYNETVAKMAHQDVIPYSVQFMEGEMDQLKPSMHNSTKMFIKLLGKLPIGKKGREMKMMIAMAEPMMEKGLDDMMQPLKDNIEAMGNKSVAAFCEGSMPIVINASAGMGFLNQTEVELKKAMQSLPQLQLSPMAFMMGDVVPKMIKVGGKMLDANQAMLDLLETQAMLLNTTFRWALESKLHCDDEMRSASASVVPGILVALAALTAWFAAL